MAGSIAGLTDCRQLQPFLILHLRSSCPNQKANVNFPEGIRLASMFEACSNGGAHCKKPSSQAALSYLLWMLMQSFLLSKVKFWHVSPMQTKEFLLCLRLKKGKKTAQGTPQTKITLQVGNNIKRLLLYPCLLSTRTTACTAPEVKMFNPVQRKKPIMTNCIHVCFSPLYLFLTILMASILPTF